MKHHHIINQATEAFQSRFSRQINVEDALVGIESEFPLVDKEGNAAPKEIVIYPSQLNLQL